MSRSIFLLAVGLLAGLSTAATPEEDEARTVYHEMKLISLKKFLFERGVECPGCKDKTDWADKAYENRDAEIQPELVEQWKKDKDKRKREKDYQKKVRDFNSTLTKEDFIKQMNETREGAPLTEAIADRLWSHFQGQMEKGTVEFLENGTVRFQTPMHLSGHPFMQYLPLPVLDIIEMMSSGIGHVWGAVRSILPSVLNTKLDEMHNWVSSHPYTQTVVDYLLVIMVGLVIVLILDEIRVQVSSKQEQPPAPTSTNKRDKKHQ